MYKLLLIKLVGLSLLVFMNPLKADALYVYAPESIVLTNCSMNNDSEVTCATIESHQKGNASINRLIQQAFVGDTLYDSFKYEFSYATAALESQFMNTTLMFHVYGKGNHWPHLWHYIGIDDFGGVKFQAAVSAGKWYTVGKTHYCSHRMNLISSDANECPLLWLNG